MSNPCKPPFPVSTIPQPERRGAQQVVRPEGPKAQRLKEFLKAALMRSQTGALPWRQEVHGYFLARAQENKEGKVKLQWCLPVGEGEAPAKELLFKKAQEVAKSLKESQEVANKFKRLVARVSVCRDKTDLLVAVARFFPNLKAGTQQALNACEKQWQAWDIRSLQKIFLLTKIFLEAQE